MRRSASAPLLASGLLLPHTVETVETAERAIPEKPTVQLPSGLSLSLLTELSHSDNFNETIRTYFPKASDNEHFALIEQIALYARSIHQVTGSVKSRFQDLGISTQIRQEVQHYHPTQPSERLTVPSQFNVGEHASHRKPPQAPVITVPSSYIVKVIMQIKHNSPATSGELLILLTSFFPKTTRIELQELFVSTERFNECLHSCSGAANKLLSDHVFLSQTQHHTLRPAGMRISTPDQEQPLPTSPVPDESMPSTSFLPEPGAGQPDAEIDSDALPETPAAPPRLLRCVDGMERRAVGAYVYVKESEVEGYGAFARTDIPKGKVYAEHNGFFVYKIHLNRRVKEYVVCNTLDKDEELTLYSDDRFVAWLDLYYLVGKTKIEIGINGTRAISFINHSAEKERINTKLVVRYPAAPNGKPIKTIKSRSDYENYLHNIYINVQATKDIEKNTELFCNYLKEGDQKTDPFERNVLPPSEKNQKRVSQIIKRTYKDYTPQKKKPDEREESPLNYETDIENLSDMELEETPLPKPRRSNPKPTDINLYDISKPLASFYYDILCELHNAFEESGNCRLHHVIEKIKNSKKKHAQSYPEILKLIAQWIIVTNCPDTDINKDKVIENMEALAKTSTVNAESLLQIESRFVQSCAFNITIDEWMTYHRTGQASSPESGTKRTCTVATKTTASKRQRRESPLYPTQTAEGQ